MQDQVKRLNESSNRTVDRALDILNLISENNEEGMTLSEISRSLNIPKGSLHSILHSLAYKRYLFVNEREKRYYLGEELFNLGNRFMDRTNILTLIAKIMEGAVNQTGYTSFFGVLSGVETRYLLQKVAKSQLQIVAAPRYALKAHCTGLGKAMLIDWSDDRIRRMFTGEMSRITEATITDVEQLIAEIGRFRETGIAAERGESSPQVQCFAAPVRYQGHTIASVSIAFPIWIEEDQEMERIRTALMDERQGIEGIIAEHPHAWTYSPLDGI